MSWKSWHEQPHKHGHHGRPGRVVWGGYPPPWYDWGYHVGYEYIPSDVYYTGEVFSIEAFNAGRSENIGQGVSWSAAVVGAQAFLQNNPPAMLPGSPGSYVRIRQGYGGPVVCEWLGTPAGWEQSFCDPGSWGYAGLGEEAAPSRAGVYVAAGVALLIVGAIVLEES